MAKRPLGLGKKGKNKKQRGSEDNGSSREITPVNQIQVEVDESSDPDDVIVQLRSLWKCYLSSERDDEMVLNGIIHECDRLLRNQELEKTQLNDEFHSIYGLALSELTIFKAGEEDEDKRKKEINEFFEAALERIELGLTRFPSSQLLMAAKAKVLFQRIPLQYVSQLTPESGNADELRISELLEEGKGCLNIIDDRPWAAIEPLEIFNDLLDIISNFGNEEELDEGLDSDDEENLNQVELDESHPLYKVRADLDEHFKWLREQLVKLFETLPKPTEADIEEDTEIHRIYRKVAKTVAQAFLDAASEPSMLFTTYVYDVEDASEEDMKKAKIAQKEAQKYTKTAIEYFKHAEANDDPESWVDTAEVFITLGNLQTNESPEQLESYKIAEERIRKANKATSGKYEHILDTLLNCDS